MPITKDENLKSVVAWLRSDRFLVQATKEEGPASDFSFVSKLLTHTLMKPLPYPQQFIGLPDSTDQVALGKYTADAIGDCFACHSGSLVDQDKVHTERTKGYYSGGIEMVEVGAIFDYLKTVPKIQNDIAQKNAELQLATK